MFCRIIKRLKFSLRRRRVPKTAICLKTMIIYSKRDDIKVKYYFSAECKAFWVDIFFFIQTDLIRSTFNHQCQYIIYIYN